MDKKRFDLLRFMKPDEIDNVNPLYELYDSLKGMTRQVVTTIVTSVLTSLFLSGLLYQIYAKNIIRSQRYIYILSSFKYGFKVWPLALLFASSFMYSAYRLHMAYKKGYKKNYKDGYLVANSKENGGGHFQTQDEMEKNGFDLVDSFDETDREIFGIYKGKYLAFDYPPGLNHNKVFFGAPGSGKSAAIIKTDMYQAFKRGESIIVTDSKGDLYKDTASLFMARGYKVRVINLKPSEFRNSDGFNLLTTISKDDEERDAKAAQIANAIIMNTQISQNLDYWSNNEFNLLKAIILYVSTNEEVTRNGNNNLGYMLEFLTNNDCSRLTALFSNITDPADPIRIAFNIFAEAGKNQESIKNGLEIRLAILANPSLRRVLASHEVDFTAPMKEKCIYYVVISDTDTTYKFVATLFFTTLFDQLCAYSDGLTPEEKKKQLSVNFLLDEYRNIGGIAGMPVKIATVRSRKIGLTLILQDKGQLATVHPIKGEAETILNCCTIKGLLSTNDYDTALYFSNLLATQTVVKRDIRVTEGTDDIIKMHGSGSYGEGKMERPLMSPAELMDDTLSSDLMIYYISKQPPIKCGKPFSEKGGESIHPCEIEARDLGYKMPNRHKPLWRKADEDKEAERLARLEEIKNGKGKYKASAENNPGEPTAPPSTPKGSPVQPTAPTSTPKESPVQPPAPKPSAPIPTSAPDVTPHSKKQDEAKFYLYAFMRNGKQTGSVFTSVQNDKQLMETYTSKNEAEKAAQEVRAMLKGSSPKSEKNNPEPTTHPDSKPDSSGSKSNKQDSYPETPCLAGEDASKSEKNEAKTHESEKISQNGQASDLDKTASDVSSDVETKPEECSDTPTVSIEASSIANEGDDFLESEKNSPELEDASPHALVNSPEPLDTVDASTKPAVLDAGTSSAGDTPSDMTTSSDISTPNASDTATSSDTAPTTSTDVPSPLNGRIVNPYKPTFVKKGKL